MPKKGAKSSERLRGLRDFGCKRQMSSISTIACQPYRGAFSALALTGSPFTESAPPSKSQLLSGAHPRLLQYVEGPVEKGCKVVPTRGVKTAGRRPGSGADTGDRTVGAGDGGVHADRVRRSVAQPLHDARFLGFPPHLESCGVEVEAERSLRGVAVGRRNWTFFGSDNDGHTAAVLTSLIATCKRHHRSVRLFARRLRAHCLSPQQPNRRATPR